jgi:hypothetical protein
MFPGLECDEAKFVHDPVYSNSSIGFRSANVTYRSKACDIESTSNLADPTQRAQRQNKWAAENYMGLVQAVDCSGDRSFLIAVTQSNRGLDITQYR